MIIQALQYPHRLPHIPVIPAYNLYGTCYLLVIPRYLLLIYLLPRYQLPPYLVNVSPYPCTNLPTYHLETYIVFYVFDRGLFLFAAQCNGNVEDFAFKQLNGINLNRN